MTSEINRCTINRRPYQAHDIALGSLEGGSRVEVRECRRDQCFEIR